MGAEALEHGPSTFVGCRAYVDRRGAVLAFIGLLGLVWCWSGSVLVRSGGGKCR